MRIFLVGFMGVGKSTLGQLVADELKLPFFDLDKIIEEEYEDSISQIFSEKGEDYFRKLENEMLTKSIKAYSDFVMGTGGGLPCFYDNMDLMIENGTTVYLKASVVDISHRLASSSGKRPLVARKSGSELQAFVDELLGKRATIYEQSTLVVDLDLRHSKDGNAGKIATAIKHYFNSIEH